MFFLFYDVKFAFCLYSVAFTVMMLANSSATAMLKGLETFKSAPYYSVKREIRNDSVEFEDTEEEVVAGVGETVKLRCSVNNLGDNVVSWIRRKNLHILTTGTMTFTRDSRFQVHHLDDNSDSWDLMIVDVQSSDSGMYECQINTEPKLKRSVLLIVLSENGKLDMSSIADIDNTLDMSKGLIASIIGPKQHFIRLGSRVTLTCLVRFNGSSDNTEFHYSSYQKPVLWFHFWKWLSVQSNRRGINIDTERLTNMVVSRLTIVGVSEDDSGVYICKPIKGEPCNITLSIVNDEETEAVKPENYLPFNNATKDDIVTWEWLFLLFTSLFIRFPS